jgi:hypothetical protein
MSIFDFLGELFKKTFQKVGCEHYAANGKKRRFILLA